MSFMDLFRMGGRCKFCGQPAALFIVYTVIYARDKYHYHASCLKEVLSFPEKYGGEKVDIAIAIQQTIDGERERERRKYEAARALAERIK